MAKRNISSKEQKEIEEWPIVFKQLSTALFQFNVKNPVNAGQKLYSLCIKNNDFLINNLWIKKFENDYKIKSLDPIHVFASINNNKFSGEKRVAIINSYFKILTPKSNLVYTKINFTGCPSPAIIHIIGSRQEDKQREIWNAFLEIYKNEQKALTDKLFKQIKGWYGIELKSFTIFLFWINSSSFIPLDKNTINYLLKEGIIDTPPKTYSDYFKLLKFNNSDVYRSIAKISYDYNQIDLIDSSEKAELEKYLKTGKSASKQSTSRSQNDFKIIAIKPLNNFNDKLLKVLNINETYFFYKGYEIIDTDTIKVTTENEYNLYSNQNLQINISAIVGKNGTGKSTIADIFYSILNNIAYEKLHINSKEEFEKVDNINIEFYFKTITLYKVILNNNNNIVVYQYKEGKDGIFKIVKKINLKDFPLENLFYTIGVNYSLYSLNELHIGHWIHSLFHKNDAYQTPIVLEPFRDKGNIDVNKQEGLVKSRLLANLLELEQEGDNNSFRNLTDNLKAEHLQLVIHHDKTVVFCKDEKGDEVTDPDEIKNASNILKLLFKSFDVPDSKSNMDNPIDVDGQAKRYLLKKLISISTTYKNYNGYFNGKKLIFEKEEDYIKKLAEDKSHITYKLRQTLNYLIYKHFDYKKSIVIDELSVAIENIKSKSKQSKNKELLTIELIPPPFFKVEIKMTKGVTFEKLSSGEKQKIYSVNSIIYHLRNIDSISESKKNIVSYRNVNLFLDEVELYFHPEMQRTYVNYLLFALNKISWQTIYALNICFVTHSPFILSDISTHNILFLNSEDKKLELNELKTFGSNIHELLVSGFFMDNTIGDFALDKINEIIAFHTSVLEAKSPDELVDLANNYKVYKRKFYYVISILGEEYIKRVLQNHIYDIERRLSEKSYVSTQIKLVQDELKRLTKIQNA